LHKKRHEPCPWRIVDDCGGTFVMAVTCDKVFQAMKGFRSDPVGIRHQLRGSVNTLLGWGGCFPPSTGLVWLQGKEDFWNSITTAHSGPLAMVGSAMIGGRGVGILLALIQCVGNLHTHYTIQQFRSALPLLEKPNQLPPKEGTEAPGYPSYQQCD
uniref:Uncharacterized protein n=1 Tax=Capra hircus TaxID=9925 RepID=A0A452FN45_CAPHI